MLVFLVKSGDNCTYFKKMLRWLDLIIVWRVWYTIGFKNIEWDQVQITTAVRVAGRRALLFSLRVIARDSDSTKGSWLCFQQALTVVIPNTGCACV